MIRYVLQSAPPRVRLIAYYTLCRPVLEYGCEVWDPTNRQLIDKLEVFQNKVLRYTFNIRGRDTSMTKIKATHQIPLLEIRRSSIRAKTFLNILENNQLHPYLDSVINKMLTNNLNVTTRSQSCRPTYCNTTLYFNSFIQRTARDLRLGNITEVTDAK